LIGKFQIFLARFHIGERYIAGSIAAIEVAKRVARGAADARCQIPCRDRLCLAAPLAEAAGFRFIDVPADADGPALTGAMWYPCSEPPGKIDLGSGITVSGVKDCPISGDQLPLVVVSHGAGGNIVGHHDMAETLAAINHPGHTTSDMSHSGDLSVFVERPTDIKRLIDFMLGASPATSKIDPHRIGFFGFSAGGYTGLVLIGANPDWAIPFCTVFHDPREPSSAAPVCEHILRKGFRCSLSRTTADQGRRHRRPVLPLVHVGQLRRGQGAGSAVGVRTSDRPAWNADALR